MLKGFRAFSFFLRLGFGLGYRAKGFKVSGLGVWELGCRAVASRTIERSTEAPYASMSPKP